jgi:hypothetical protein
MTTVQLPLNNSVAMFTSSYSAYVNVFELDKVTYVYGQAYDLFNTLNGNGIKAILNSPNTIRFSPFTIIDSSSFWFNQVGGKYVPQKWVNNSFYQAITVGLQNVFIFQGNFNNNTLHTPYGTNYTVKAFIIAFDSGFNVLANTYSPITNGNFKISLDTTSISNVARIQWGFEMSGYPVYVTETNDFGSININEIIPCFKSDTKILTINGYIPIQNLEKGDLIKTLKHDYVPIHMIGHGEIINPICDERTKNKLYVCSQEEYPEIFEDLVITGSHSILVDEFKNAEERANTLEVLGNICVTDKKYRLPACVDNRAIPYEKLGSFTIYHFALENDDYFMNYGIYANGLLVETCSKRFLQELSNMTFI